MESLIINTSNKQALQAHYMGDCCSMPLPCDTKGMMNVSRITMIMLCILTNFLYGLVAVPAGKVATIPGS